jgi:hypothetical protein
MDRIKKRLGALCLGLGILLLPVLGFGEPDTAGVVEKADGTVAATADGTVAANADGTVAANADGTVAANADGAVVDEAVEKATDVYIEFMKETIKDNVKSKKEAVEYKKEAVEDYVDSNKDNIEDKAESAGLDGANTDKVTEFRDQRYFDLYLREDASRYDKDPGKDGTRYNLKNKRLNAKLRRMDRQKKRVKERQGGGN